MHDIWMPLALIVIASSMAIASMVMILRIHRAEARHTEEES